MSTFLNFDTQDRSIARARRVRDDTSTEFRKGCETKTRPTPDLLSVISSDKEDTNILKDNSGGSMIRIFMTRM